MEAGAFNGGLSFLVFDHLFLSEESKRSEDAEFDCLGGGSVIVKMLKIGIRQILFIVKLSLSHQFAPIDVELIRIVNK